MSESPKKIFIAKAPIRRLMKSEGASLVSNDALTFTINYLVEKAKDVAKEAKKIAKEDGHKRISGEDIQKASRIVKLKK